MHGNQDGSMEPDDNRNALGVLSQPLTQETGQVEEEATLLSYHVASILMDVSATTGCMIPGLDDITNTHEMSGTGTVDIVAVGELRAPNDDQARYAIRQVYRGNREKYRRVSLKSESQL